MVNEDDQKPIKKPVPLPRKSLYKQNKVTPVQTDNEVEGNCTLSQKKTNFVRDDWKSASGSFVFEKSRQVKNEVQKFEKSVKNIISKRKSVQNKSQSTSVISEHRNDSLPDDSIFLNISFNSPLTDDEKQSDSQSVTFSEDSSLYENDLSPPSYPPPDLPDESVYDKMRNFKLSDQCSCKSASSDSTSTYEELSATQSMDINFMELFQGDFSSDKVSPKCSLQYSDRDKDNRYEIIEENICGSIDSFKPLPNIPEFDTLSLSSGKDLIEKNLQSSHMKYIIHLFDPLQETVEEKGIVNHKNTTSESQKHCDDFYSNIVEKPFKNLKKSESFKLNISPSSSENSSLTLQEGVYGKIRKVNSTANEYVKLKCNSETKSLLEPPPIPPRKIDLKSSEVKHQRDLNEKYENIPVEEKTKHNDILPWSSLKRVAKKVADNIENRASYISLSGKRSGKLPAEDSLTDKSSEVYSLPTQSFPKHSGVLFRAGGIQRWGVLSQRKLTLFANKDSPDVKETVPMDGVLSAQVTHDKIGMENMGVYCFEISISSRSQPLLFGVPSVSERHVWMRKLLESIGPSFPAKVSMDYTKAGWCYAKENISCAWNKCCILLHQRTLYLSTELGSFITSDLRKARKIGLQNEDFACDKVTEKGPLMLIDLQDKTLYLQMDYERETKSWEGTITAAALKNGPTLAEQQLTKDDVPAIVDKCLNFVHTHGCFSEGIYRRNGSNRTVSQLLAAFRCNAWSVQLSKDNCSEFDVSSVLKRYFRDLPEPLFVPETHEDLGSVMVITHLEERIEKYKEILARLPKINYLTARRLMGHLYCINKQKDKNLMGAENLAAIWGPTLLQVQDQVTLDSDCFKLEAFVINDLITYYPEIFDVDKSEVEREMKILEMLETYYKNSSNSLNKKPSGELKIWVYLDSAKNVDNCVNISISPQKTAEEICKDLSHKTKDPVHLLCLEETVCRGHLTRPLNHSEKVLETVLRWSYWDEQDRKDNCLVLTKNNLFQEVAQNAKYPVIFCEELKFADQKSKSFKTYQFEFSQAKLLCYKDKSCSQKVSEWKIEDIIWYFGYEPKRNPQARWSITFIEKQLIGPRCKERPFFGNTICGSSEEQKFKLISAMLTAQYAKDILPTPNLME